MNPYKETGDIRTMKNTVLKSVMALSIVATLGTSVGQGFAGAEENNKTVDMVVGGLKTSDTLYTEKDIEDASPKSEKDTTMSEEQKAKEEKKKALKEKFKSESETKYELGVFKEKDLSARDYKEVGAKFKSRNSSDFGQGNQHSLYFGPKKVTLKEIDERLRKILVKYNGLYSTYSGGTAVVKLYGGNDQKYTLELGEELQKNRENHEVDTRNIDKIEIDLEK